MYMVLCMTLCIWYYVCPYVCGIMYVPMYVVLCMSLCMWYYVCPYVCGIMYVPMYVVLCMTLCNRHESLIKYDIVYYSNAILQLLSYVSLAVDRRKRLYSGSHVHVNHLLCVLHNRGLYLCEPFAITL